MNKFFVEIYVIVMMGVSTASAKAYYAPKSEMIENSCAIAIIHVKDAKEVKSKGVHWDYNELANVDVEKVIKGTLPPSIELLGDENFICEQCKVTPGKYLAFLKPEGNKWVCANWYLSVRPIEGTQVKWYENEFGLKLSSRSLDSVIKDIEKQILNSPKGKNQKNPCLQQKPEMDKSTKSLLDSFNK